MYDMKFSSFSSWKMTLAYDSSCSMCVETARSIRDVSEGKLDVVPLNSDYVSAAFAYLGKEVRYDKPLIVLEKEGVYKIYDGYRFGLIFAKCLGPRRAWRVLQTFGDRKNYANSGWGVSRKSFLKGVAGAFGAAAVLSGVRPASAANKNQSPLRVEWFERARIQDSTEMSDVDSLRVVTFFATGDMSKKLGLNENILRQPDCTIRGVLHNTVDGNVIKAVSVQIPQRVYFLYEGIGFANDTLHSSRVLEIDGLSRESDMSVNLVATSEGGSVTKFEPQNSVASSRCNSAECRKRGRCYGCACTSWDLKCLVNCCGPCAFACGNPWSCLACVGIWCVVCSNWSNPCCRASGCQYIDRSTC